jgi:Tfp pilus assembly major pilin PilA
MKKNQSGVSMVSLVITIIVIIILAAVAFSGSQETIGRAGFSGFTTDIDSVRTAFLTEGVTSLMGEQTAANNTVSEAQAYNFLAKGATTTLVPAADGEHAWLSRAQANAIPCTRIEKESAKEAIGIELPERTVNTFGATGVEVSYFVTNKGDIFVWPPYARSDDGLFYVNDTMTVTKSGDTSPISGDDEALMYPTSGTFEFMVNGVGIVVSTTEHATAVTPATTAAQLQAMPSVYYVDQRNASSPEGIESKAIYQDDNGTVAGVDKEDFANS